MENQSKNILVAFFSRSGQNYSNGSIVNLEVGNTSIAADFIKNNTNADLFEIKTESEYPLEYRACTKQAYAELKANSRPKLAYDIDIKDYDTIFIGFPNWCGTMPMAVFTFLESHDFSGKTIAPFCTNEGSGMGRSENDLKKLLSTAKIKKGLSIHGSEVKMSKSLIENWLKTI